MQEVVIDFGIRKRLLKAYVWSVALYGREAWIIGKEEILRLKVFATWCYRTVMRIGWEDKVTNEAVLELVGEMRSIWRVLQRRRDRLLGHILRHGDIIPQQNGFCPNRSITTNLLPYTEYLIQNIDSGGQVDIIFTEYQKAFDKEEHNL